MVCQFERLLYPQNPHTANPGSYMVAIYRPCDKLRDRAGNLVTRVKAVGYCLPTAANLRYNMQGHWTKHAIHGVQFEVENYEEVIVPTREGILAYLSSGQIKGIGPAIAERIYQTFGAASLEVLDKEPEKLLSIPGISINKLKKICDSYLLSRGARDIIAFLAPHGITPNRAIKLFRQYGAQTMDMVKNHPYQLSEMTGIGFRTADKIAASMGFDLLSPERVDAGILFTLTEAEGRGHLCLDKKTFLKACMKTLDTPELTRDMVASRASRLVFQGQLVCYEDQVYREKTARAEDHLTKQILRQLRSRPRNICKDLDDHLAREEAALHLKLAPEQQDAVKMALSSSLSIITGGPGTGKTLIQKAILDIYRKQYPDGKICCCAPTGRAARRMEQSTGHFASTVHSALGLLADDEGIYSAPDAMDEDLVLVDEVSMLDIYLAGHLFDALKPGCQLVLIGDADQLPSVGPGVVLKEMIDSGTIPVVRLDKVYRQSAGSRIAINARLIRHNNVGLEYGADFRFLDSSSMEQSARMIADLYLQEVQTYGVDNVALLSPFRQKTATGVNALNTVLQQRINPPGFDKTEVTRGTRIFRVGDKVMQNRNHDDVNNGDIGYITQITRSGDETTVQIDFGDDRLLTYDLSDLDMLDLGYALTVHKSQGSEYQSVIINLQSAHAIMLTRPLIYTAITRGKEKVTIVGERRALCLAIKRADVDQRGTCLAHRLQVQNETERSHFHGQCS